MNRSLIAVVAAGLTLAACEGFKEALTAHVDVAARAESQELSVERLAEMIGNTDFPISPEFARTLSGLWVDYQLLGHAAAAGDSLKDTTRLDKVLWPMIAEARVNAFHDTMQAAGPKYDSTANEARYGQGEVLAARHILFRTTPTMTPAQKDSVRRRAEATRARVTAANFAQIAGQTNDDPTAKQQGGSLGLFPRGAMVKEFEQAVLSLQPGQISPLVETQFGYHIIRRAPYSEVRGEIGEAMQRRATQVGDSTFVANLEAGANVQLEDDAAGALVGGGLRGRVALQLLATRQQEDLGLELPQPALDDEAVAAVVALPAEDDYTSPLGKARLQCARHGATGIFHQHRPADPERLDRAAVRRAHLLRVQHRNHEEESSAGRRAGRKRPAPAA